MTNENSMANDNTTPMMANEYDEKNIIITGRVFKG